MQSRKKGKKLLKTIIHNSKDIFPHHLFDRWQHFPNRLISKWHTNNQPSKQTN